MTPRYVEPAVWKVGDGFCGAGGFSTGAKIAFAGLGLFMSLVAVLNHWDVAIKTHSLNHPEAHHIKDDVYQVDPHEAVPGGHLDLLLASPTCIFNSRARGGKPISWDQRKGRMTPWQVYRWLRALHVESFIVENVPEFRGWGPVHAEDWEPLDSRRGRRCVEARCRAGKACVWQKGTYFRRWKKRIEGLGYSVEARVLNAADFGDPTTRERIFVVGTLGAPFVWPMPTHAKGGGEPDLFGNALPCWRSAWSIIDHSIRGTSLFTRKKRLSDKTLERIYAGLVRFNWPWPFRRMLRAYIDRKPLPKFTASDLERAEPFAIPQGGGGVARSLEEPLATIATDGAHAFVVPYYGTGVCRSVDQPLPTVTTKDRFAFIAAAFGERKGQRARVHSIEEPAPTVCAKGRLPLVQADLLEIDILYRMAEPHELAGAMGFPAGYHFFSKKKGDLARQIGNAVPVNTAAALVRALVTSRRPALQRVAS